MEKFNRSIVLIICFIVNYYIIVGVYQKLDMSVYQLDLTLTFMVFVSMLIVSFYKADIGYLFGSMAFLYCPLIVLRSGFSVESLAALASTSAGMFATVGKPGINKISDIFSSFFEFFESPLSQMVVVRRIRKTAGQNSGTEKLSENQIQEFLQMEAAAGKISDFFNSTKNAAYAEALSETSSQILSLQTDHARLLLRASHLEGFLKESDTNTLEAEVRKILAEASKAEDDVIKAQLNATAQMKEKRIAEIGKLRLCLQRIDIQRMQMIETAKSTFESLNALTFSDVKTLQASSDSISKSIIQIRNNLEDFESGVMLMEDLTKE